MKKFLLPLLLFCSLIGFSEPITLEQAEQAAKVFLARNNSTNMLKSDTEITLTDIGDIFSKPNNQLKSNSEERTMFLFNIGDSAGFIIVSGDNTVQPILGYSNEGKISAGTIPPPVMAWLEGYKQQILIARKNSILPNTEIKKMWSGNYPVLKSSGYVDPLCKTKWDQNPYYNDMCPWDYDSVKRTVTGCPATAMAQIMKYWNYPAKGFGFHSYNHSKYGTLSANFSGTTYDWDNMPNEVNSTNDAVALLMYHCGVAVEMDYGVKVSSSYLINEWTISKEKTCEYAYPTYFGYDTNIKGIHKKDYSDREWKNLLKNELDNGRPVQYRGADKESGHTWVCDGYDENDYFHMNWGWGGFCDGFYALDNLTTYTEGTGAGNGSYNSVQAMLIGIQPRTTEDYELILFDDVTISSSSITYGSGGFTVSVNLKNKSSYDFYGDYAAAIFDANNTFIDMVEIKEGYSLPADYSYSSNLKFTTSGMLDLYPGNYKIYICYRAKGGSWTIADNNFWHNYDTYASLQVNPYKSDIRLYKDLSIVSDHIYSGDKFVVNTDVANYSDYDFEGYFVLALIDKNDKKNGGIIDYIEESLPSMYCFGGDGLTFSTDSLEVSPGSYYMVLMYYSSNDFGDDLIGSTSEYFNPVEIIVQEKPLEPDKYEYNNSMESAYPFDNLTFSGNKATVNTSGANIQNGSDIDYYAIELADGYLYSISGFLHDSYSEEDSEYTGDMKVAYSFDGEIWSDVYDTEIDEFIINGSGTVYFVVSSYFGGGHGTYNLELSIQRSTMIQPDKYESNNTLEDAYVFKNISFNDDEAELFITDANFHGLSDGDVYKLQLNKGYIYYLQATLIDRDSIDLPSMADGVFLYSTDGETSSELFDNIMEEYAYIEAYEDSYVYFAVGQYDIGSIGSYQLKIDISRDTLLLSDKYEFNNSMETAYEFKKIPFENNIATIVTTGANIHEDIDFDFYAIYLEDGYSYSISAQVKDAYTEDSPKASGDVVFVYAFDNENYSDDYFDVKMDEPLVVENASIVYFMVYGYLLENIGAYELQIDIQRDTILLADAYEPNNRESSARKLDYSFDNDRVTIFAEDANIQNANDYDFYKVSLEAGYKYTIDIQVKDVNSGMFSFYTSDVSFKYSVNGKADSKTYEEALPEQLVLEGANDIRIGVWGTKGTYSLEISIQRKVIKPEDSNDIGDIAMKELIVYPNPCKDEIFVKSSDEASQFVIYDTNGRIVKKGFVNNGTINVSYFPCGTYNLRVKVGDTWLQKKIIKE